MCCRDGSTPLARVPKKRLSIYALSAKCPSEIDRHFTQRVQVGWGRTTTFTVLAATRTPRNHARTADSLPTLCQNCMTFARSMGECSDSVGCFAAYARNCIRVAKKTKSEQPDHVSYRPGARFASIPFEAQAEV